MLRALYTNISLFLLFVVVTGVFYPLTILALGQKLFPYQANGSLVLDNGRVVGSLAIGQSFSDGRYFHGRPSAAGKGYDANASSGSNLAPSSGDLVRAVGERIAALKKDNLFGPYPSDMVTASASGLDPDISPASARLQAARVADARHLDVAKVDALITAQTVPRTFDVLGEPRVNVLQLNRVLDALTAAGAKSP